MGWLENLAHRAIERLVPSGPAREGLEDTFDEIIGETRGTIPGNECSSNPLDCYRENFVGNLFIDRNYTSRSILDRNISERNAPTYARRSEFSGVPSEQGLNNGCLNIGLNTYVRFENDLDLDLRLMPEARIIRSFYDSFLQTGVCRMPNPPVSRNDTPVCR